KKIHLEVVASSNFIGFIDEQLYLPEYIHILEDQNKNKLLYFYLCLISSEAVNLNLKGNKTSSDIVKRLNFLYSMNEINLSLDKKYPHFINLQSQIISWVKESKYANIGIVDFEYIKYLA